MVMSTYEWKILEWNEKIPNKQTNQVFNCVTCTYVLVTIMWIRAIVTLRATYVKRSQDQFIAYHKNTYKGHDIFEDDGWKYMYVW